MEDKIKQYAKELEESIRAETKAYVESSVNEIIDEAVEKLRKLKKNTKRSTDQLLARIKQFEEDSEKDRDYIAHLLHELHLAFEHNKKNVKKLHALQLQYNTLEKQIQKPTAPILLPAPKHPCQFCGKLTDEDSYCSEECRKGSERIKQRAQETGLVDSETENEEPKSTPITLPSTPESEPIEKTDNSPAWEKNTPISGKNVSHSKKFIEPTYEKMLRERGLKRPHIVGLSNKDLERTRKAFSKRSH